MKSRIAMLSDKYMKMADAPADLEVVHDRVKGFSAIKRGGNSIEEIAKELTSHYLRYPPRAMDIHVIKGAVKVFSFRWSNAQRAWDVVIIPKGAFPYSNDGAEIILAIGPEAKSPLNRLWSITEMRYVAKKLRQHPGYANSMERGSDG